MEEQQIAQPALKVAFWDFAASSGLRRGLLAALKLYHGREKHTREEWLALYEAIRARQT